MIKPVTAYISVGIVFLSLTLVGVMWLVHRGYINQYGWDFTPMKYRHSSRQYQVVTARVFGLLDSGEYAWQRGDLKTAEARFKAVLNDKSNFPGKSSFDKKARADLTKLYQQKGQLQIKR